MKWSTNPEHRVNALECHNKAHDDSRKQKATELHGCFFAVFRWVTWFDERQTAAPARPTVLSPLIAANVTFDLNTGVWFRHGLLGMIAS